MGVTFKPVVKTRRKDGSRTVYIRVTYARQSRHIPTLLTATPSDLTRTDHIKNAALLEKAADLISRMRATLADVSPFELEDWTVDDVVRRIRDGIRGETFRLDFFAFGEQYAARKKPGTCEVYYCALNALERYLGRRELDVNGITRAMLLGFVDFVNAEPKIHVNRKTGEKKHMAVGKIENSSASRYMMKLACIYQAAKDSYNDEDRGLILIPRSPFSTVKVPAPPSSRGQRSVGVETMQRIIDGVDGTPKERIALDAFVLSFCLMGANLADLRDAQEPSGGVWEYRRRKTRDRRPDGALMRVVVPECAAPFVARLRACGERYGGVWLPALRTVGGSETSCGVYICRCLHRWAEREGLPDFTFYAARHTWATLARRAGVEKATVDECLGHVGDYRVTDIYAERSWDLLAEANAKVLALFRWPD